MSLFYKPKAGYVGDCIPFYWEGVYHVFYLLRAVGEGQTWSGGQPLTWQHIASRNLVTWEEWPEALHWGAEGEADVQGCWTGSVIEREGTFHIFYTGWEGAIQRICHATSADLAHWTKDARNPILAADPRWFEPADWRDPFCFWNEEAGEYQMLITARLNDGPPSRRGCLALAASPDLETWEARGPWWSPTMCHTHECPDLFRLGEKWRLIYSQYGEYPRTEQRVADSLAGPWLAPDVDDFDGPRNYAAKTLGERPARRSPSGGEGGRRLLFGWIATRKDENDAGPYEWGGHMSLPMELYPGPDGGLLVRCPEELARIAAEGTALALQPRLGEWESKGGKLSGRCADGFAYAFAPDAPPDLALQATIAPRAQTCGLLLRCAENLDACYMVRLEPRRQRLTFDRLPRLRDTGSIEAERPMRIKPGKPIALRVFLEGSTVQVFAGDTTALSARAYDFKHGGLGVFVACGEATFESLRVAPLA
jgi:beta-fructofuranosidase